MGRRNPYPLLEKSMKVIPPADMLPVDLDDPAVWHRSDLPADHSITVHWGGGPNIAGDSLPEEPEMTLREKIAVTMGLVRRVLTGWHRYHVVSRGMSAIAYCTAIPIRYSRVVRLRGHRVNGGQWGSINQETHAVVFVLGAGQYPGRAAWRTLGMIWFCGGGPMVWGHRDWNDDRRTQTTTYCPGNRIWQGIIDRKYVTALGRLRKRRNGTFPGGRRVRMLTGKLQELEYLDRQYHWYRRVVRRAVEDFQWNYGLDEDGVVGPVTWAALAKV